jgi:hypothetical protein
MLLEAAGDALARRGYALQEDAIQIRSGLYRFSPAQADDAPIIDVQLLFYSGGGPSRFEVKVWRGEGEKRKLGVWLRAQGIETLADESGWWEFVSGQELEEALKDATSGLERMLNVE